MLAFGTLDDGRRYLVREMIDGRSIEGWLDRPDASARPLLVAMTTALEQLVVLHRAQMFHGDIKPANVIVDPDGHGRLVDLGLAVRARGGTALPRGLTPAYAAPELFEGAPISARTEVFAAGRSLARIIEDATGLDLDEQRNLTELVARATANEPSERFPSIDELRVALMNVLGRSDPMFREASAWPIVGIDHATNTLVDRARDLDMGHVLVVHAAPRSGKSTVLRRVGLDTGRARGAYRASRRPALGIRGSGSVAPRTHAGSCRPPGRVRGGAR